MRTSWYLGPTPRGSNLNWGGPPDFEKTTEVVLKRSSLRALPSTVGFLNVARDAERSVQLCPMILLTWNMYKKADLPDPESAEECLGTPSSTGGFMIMQVWETWPSPSKNSISDHIVIVGEFSYN